MYYKIVVFIIYVLISTFCSASPPPINNHALKDLSENQQWLKLLAFERKNNTQYARKSAITSDDFFLSASGSHDPYQELLATLQAFNLPLGKTKDEHAQCRFRDRFFGWIKNSTLKKNLPAIIDCPNYVNWTGDQKIDSLSLVYATGYLGNPASYYGHLLLKLNSSEKNKSRKLDDVTVNFGASIPTGENMILYITKGLLGLYTFRIYSITNIFIIPTTTVRMNSETCGNIN
ncbi:MAG: DUF4105 domain-containing protein [Marinagarivorans sp.]|nr:DUF4105 domain-containing protein [Marinagarivorans sp.]